MSVSRRKAVGTRAGWLRTVLSGLALLAIVSPLAAQNPQCDQIRQQIAAIDQSGGGRGNAYDAAAQKQQAELQRTSAYAHSLGCDSQSFFFGAQPPAQCGALNARIRAMQANLGQLQGMAGRSGGGNYAQRQDLVARYNAYCRNQPRGFFESLFGGGSRQSYEEIPAEPPMAEDGDDQQARGGSQAICVRTCDGGFFPLNYSARRGNMDNLEDLCHALCPNVETKLFTRNPNNEVGTAVGADGTNYSDLENAFKFQKSFDKACTCKPADVSWTQALAQSDAERILGQERKGDIIVTPEKSLEMSRPKMDPGVRSKLLANDPSRATTQNGKPTGPQPLPAQTSGAQPAPPPQPNNAKPSANDGETAEIIGADGVKRRVRIVGPTP